MTFQRCQYRDSDGRQCERPAGHENTTDSAHSTHDPLGEWDKRRQATLPPDPITTLGAGAVQLHETFVALVRAGFKRDEAIYLVGQIVTAAVTNGVQKKGPA